MVPPKADSGNWQQRLERLTPVWLQPPVLCAASERCAPSRNLLPASLRWRDLERPPPAPVV
jgi:hypothetical protein